MNLKMNLGDAAIDAVMGYAIVFLGIALLVPAPAPVPAAEQQPAPVPAAPAAPGTAGDLKLYDTPDRDAAMIMAIVADELKIPLNELRFISIREVKKS